MRLGSVVKSLVLYMKESDIDRIEGVLITIHQSCYAQLCELDDEETKNMKLQQ